MRLFAPQGSGTYLSLKMAQWEADLWLRKISQLVSSKKQTKKSYDFSRDVIFRQFIPWDRPR